MKFTHLLILLAILLNGCNAPDSVQPALTPIPSATFAPIPTATTIPSPTAEPLPPGSIALLIENELRGIFPGTPSAKVLMSAADFAKAYVPKDLINTFIKISPDGSKIVVVACADRQHGYCQNSSRVLVGTIGGEQVVPFDNQYKGGLIRWAPTSDQVLIQWSAGNRTKQIISAKPGSFGTVVTLPDSDSAFWSFDGTQVYFYDNGFYVVNSDGTNKQPVKCDLCALAGSPSAFAMQQSPDGQYVAVGYMDGTIVIAHPDMTGIQIGNAGGYISRVLWSPDSTKVAADVDVNPSRSEVVIIGLNAKIIETLPHPENTKYMLTCSWSPDSQWINYQTLIDGGYGIYVQGLGQPAPMKLLDLMTAIEFCPVWLP